LTPSLKIAVNEINFRDINSFLIVGGDMNRKKKALAIGALATLVGLMVLVYLPKVDLTLKNLYTKSYAPKEDGVIEGMTITKGLSSEQMIAQAREKVRDNPTKAWTHLDEALKKNPDSPALLVYKARFLEELGQKKEAEAIHQLNIAKNSQPELEEEYALFLLREGRFDEGKAHIEKGLSKGGRESLWLTAYLLNHCRQPSNIPYQSVPLAKGPYQPYIFALYKTPERALPQSEDIADTPLVKEHQGAYYLALLCKLKEGRDQETLTFLENSPFQAESWNPELEMTLRQILTYRLKRSLDTPGLEKLEKRLQKKDTQPTQLREILGKKKVDQNLRSLLLSKEAFAIALADSGWKEGAIKFHTLPVYPENFPTFAAPLYSKCLWELRGAPAAMAFVQEQSPSTSLCLVESELLIELGNDRMAELLLTDLLKWEDTAKRALVLLVKQKLKQGDVKGAERLLDQHPTFRDQEEITDLFIHQRS